MKRLTKSLNELSAKQFMTSTAALIISMVSVQALESPTNERAKMKPSITAPVDVSLEEGLAIEES